MWILVTDTKCVILDYKWCRIVGFTAVRSMNLAIHLRWCELDYCPPDFLQLPKVIIVKNIVIIQVI